MGNRAGMIPLDLLFEKDGLPSYDIPKGLERLYGGRLGFEVPRLYANFVSSLDGVVALQGEKHSSQMISGESEADRFVMGLLRACADAVLIGAGTLRAAPGSLWTPAYIYPNAAAEFAELRRDLGRSDEPRLVLLTARGEMDPHHPALEAGALVLTTSLGATELGSRLSASSTVVVLGEGGAIDLVDVIATVRGEGHEVVLSEGGPTVIAGLLQAGLLNELFLTLSPILAGRSDVRGRPGLVEGIELLPSQSIPGDLLSIRKHGSHLFLRHAIQAEAGLRWAPDAPTRA
jgi:riboflavin biosynthesis pyrimidine reductase